MAFTEFEIAEHIETIETVLWSRRRPPLSLRDQMREGQRFTGQAIELFYVRPGFNRPEVTVEEAIAKVQWVRTRAVWQLYWKRADGKWHRYAPSPEAATLAEVLRVVTTDANHCFFG
jgi:hypothetical protein